MVLTNSVTASSVKNAIWFVGP